MYTISAQTTGITSAAQMTGITSAAQMTGITSAAPTTGIYSAAQMTGITSAAQTTGVTSAAQTTGIYSAAQMTGITSATQTTGVTSALLKSTDNKVSHNILHSNLPNCIPTSSALVIDNNVTHEKSNETNMKPSTSQSTNVIVISDEDKSQYEDVIIIKQQKSDFLYQFFPLSKHSREEIRPLVEISHIESDCMSEYDKIGWNCIGALRQLKIINGDGNCYFKGISYAISGSEYFHDKVRETDCDYIE